jgi:broad specificity phosphatase PhoE
MCEEADMQILALPHTLYLVRHGETDWNVEGRLQGGRDIPLNDLGRLQAKEAAGRLRDLARTHDNLDYVCSPMNRARETMEIFRNGLGLPPQIYRVEETLREITFGEWEGMTWREVRKTAPERAACSERDKWNYVPPGGESYAMLGERIRPWLSTITQPTLTVSHGGVARAILALAGAATPKDAASIDIWQGKILVVTGARYEWA